MSAQVLHTHKQKEDKFWMSKVLNFNLSHVDSEDEVMQSLDESDLRDLTISNSLQFEPLHLAVSSGSEAAEIARVLVVFEDMLSI